MRNLLAIGLLLSAPCVASDWTEADTNRQIAYTVLHVIDWRQTRYIAKHPLQYRESNPLLGFQLPEWEHNNGTHYLNLHIEDNVKRTDRYFLVTGVAHYLIAKSLPYEWRDRFQYFTIGMQVYSVGHNYFAGVRMDF